MRPMGTNQPSMGSNGFNPNNFMQYMQQFNKFKNSFKGNPEEYVMNMISNGQMTQSQLNQLQVWANQIQSMFKF